ncbi:MAG: RAMP superfamily CRISPR-associated protein [Phycicoccus sp.]
MFAIQFHTPFRVATGGANAGADTAVDRLVPVPGSSVKGVMRAAARDILGGLGPAQHGGDSPLITEVFGDEEGHGPDSPWHWEDVELHNVDSPMLRTRIRIEGSTGTVAKGALMVAEELPPGTGQLEVWLSGNVPTDRLPTHRALLAASAGLVDGIGSDRRAGTGWVTISPDPAWAPPPADRASLLLDAGRSAR